MDWSRKALETRFWSYVCEDVEEEEKIIKLNFDTITDFNQDSIKNEVKSANE